jgi:hypothetical protein
MVAVAAMLVVVGGDRTATVEEAVMAAAEEVCVGMAVAVQCTFIKSNFFLNVTTTNTEG